MIDVYNADSLIKMQEWIDAGIRVDCIVTDPPYPTTARGTAGNSGGMLQKDINRAGKVFEHNECHISSWAPLLFKLLKDSGHAYIMTNHVNLIEYLNVLTANGFHFIKSLIWDKQNKIMGRFYMSQFEYILFFRKGEAVQINNCGTSDLLTIPNKKLKATTGNFHDTEKPVRLMEILVENSTKAGELVLDPFVGIGATPLACKNLGRKFIGCEIDKNYYDVVLKRLNNESLTYSDVGGGLF